MEGLKAVTLLLMETFSGETVMCYRVLLNVLEVFFLLKYQISVLTIWKVLWKIIPVSVTALLWLTFLLSFFQDNLLEASKSRHFFSSHLKMGKQFFQSLHFCHFQHCERPFCQLWEQSIIFTAWNSTWQEDTSECLEQANKVISISWDIFWISGQEPLYLLYSTSLDPVIQV